jgi:hypothetical protein|uniref:Uncharacterized protein n=1 Tax=Picea glauca TaxID=3330 RepID=A0A101M2C3_PICGL|nr:hypothetical protein ABT39_MTgene6231 [Picea glauca]KUM48754.1 hypothetical protein ABT39_MTgene4090 [Picea glauca]KUM49720.1 hypothetical protein ABT39_MTgene2947 [Picea glauca]QHR86092.1 hypothetical protein Q903MT_gene90 [Picea sitchensis]
MILAEPRREEHLEEPRVHAVTQGGVRTGLDADRILKGKRIKAVPMPPKFYAARQKQFLRDAVESLRNAPERQEDRCPCRERAPQLEDQISTFLKCCINILRDPQVSNRLIELLTKWLVRT